MSISKIYLEYDNLPCYKLVDVIKNCKLLLDKRPDYAVELKNTILLVKRILIKRQQVV